jgi:hypothetical protein
MEPNEAKAAFNSNADRNFCNFGPCFFVCETAVKLVSQTFQTGLSDGVVPCRARAIKLASDKASGQQQKKMTTLSYAYSGRPRLGQMPRGACDERHNKKRKKQ